METDDMEAALRLLPEKQGGLPRAKRAGRRIFDKGGERRLSGTDP
jgi:hypothetical protein